MTEISEGAVQNLKRRFPNINETEIRLALRKTKGHAGRAIIYLTSKLNNGKSNSAPFASTPKTRAKLLDPYRVAGQQEETKISFGDELPTTLTNAGINAVPEETTSMEQVSLPFQSAGKTRPLKSFLHMESSASPASDVATSPPNQEVRAKKAASRRKSIQRLEAAKKVTETGLFHATVSKVAATRRMMQNITPPPVPEQEEASNMGAEAEIGGVLQKGTVVTMCKSSIESDWSNFPAGSNRLVFQKNDKFTVFKVRGPYFVGREQVNHRAQTMDGGLAQFWAPIEAVNNGYKFLDHAVRAEAGRNLLDSYIC